jgi:Flp pilus assembly protein protease CpaA
MVIVFLEILGLLAIIFAVVQDLKTNEVADWLNYSLVIFALGARFFYSLFEGDFNILYQGLIGFGIFFAIGNIFYYSKIFAGGDAKLMYGLGAVIPFYSDFFSNVKVFFLFLFAFMLSGAIYGIIISIVLGLRNFKEFKKEFSKQIKGNKKIILLALVLGILVLIAGLFESMLFLFGAVMLLLPFLYLYSKAVEECCMIKPIKPEKLREGDWLYKSLKLGKKILEPNWEGLSMKDVIEIRKRYKGKEIKIKFGIPFTPVFLISFVFLLAVYLFKIRFF